MRLWKILMFIPVLMLFGSVFVLVDNYARTGSFIEKDVELTGGKIITFVGDVDVDVVKNVLPDDVVVRRAGSEIIIQFPYNIEEKSMIEKINTVYNVKDYNIRSVGPVLGEIFWQQAQYAVVIAFVMMGVIVFVLFRSFVPSVAVILAAVTDIVVTASFMDIVGIKLSLATIAALLMLIGYSVDTDILLTTRVLKTEAGSIGTKIRNALKTGLTMSGTTLAVLLIMISVTDAPVIEEIATVLSIGLMIDLLSTWFTNVGILRWWLERKHV